MSRRRGKSPTARSLELLRSEGFQADKVEQRIPGGPGRRPTTRDLFGCMDIVAVGHGMTVGCQTTSDAHLAERAAKTLAAEAFPLLEAAGWSVIVHGWRKRGKHWHCREVVLLPGRPVVQPSDPGSTESQSPTLFG